MGAQRPAIMRPLLHGPIHAVARKIFFGFGRELPPFPAWVGGSLVVGYLRGMCEMTTSPPSASASMRRTRRSEAVTSVARRFALLVLR